MINETTLLRNLKDVAKKIMPKGSQVWLYGSRARGEAREDSDWDILILLDKDEVEYDDFGKVAYPIEMAGWDFNVGITPIIYTKKEWNDKHLTPFFQNVQRDKITIYES